MKKMIYISTLLPDYLRDDKSKRMPQFSVDNMSGVFLEGFLRQLDIDVRVINLVPISSWPNTSERVYIKKYLA